jgi:hypothetical protein
MTLELTIVVVGAIITSIQLAFGFFLKKYFRIVDDLPVAIARIEGKLDVGSEKFNNLRKDVDENTKDISDIKLKHVSLDGRVARLERNCEIFHDAEPSGV